MQPRENVQEIENGRAADALTRLNSNNGRTIENTLVGFFVRLKSAGLDGQLIATMVEELRVGLVANTQLTLDQIKSRRTELGVDVTKIFTTEESELELKLEETWEQIIRELQARLNGVGITLRTVVTTSCEYRTSILAGSPLTQDQLKSRLIKLGVDVSRLFPA